MRRAHRPSILQVTLAAATLAIAVVAVAGGELGLQKMQTPRSTKTLQPRLTVLEGVLHQDRLGAWVLDDRIPLRQSRDLVWREERSGRDGSPAAGRTVRLAGQWYGGVFKVTQATLISPDRVVQRQLAPPIATAGEEPQQLPE